MSAFKVKKLSYLMAGTALLGLVVAQGCGTDDDSQATPMGGAGKSSAGAGGKSSAGAGGKASGGDTSMAGATIEDGGAAGSPDDMGMGGEGGGGAECSDPTGCYSCEPTTNDQFLNHCVEGGCPAHFDNSTLTKKNMVGTL